MRTTDNFDLDLYEGNDVFNPLITENGNMEKIDEQMQKNFDGSIGVATELTSGTVHALTRIDETPVFRFVATSNYVAGDTFTVDGLQVTGLLADGRTLSDGAYVINANVLCCLTGTVLTLYVTAGSVTTADNSLKLGGELPAYYGTATDVADAKNIANASSVIANNAQTVAENASASIAGIGTTSTQLLSITSPAKTTYQLTQATTGFRFIYIKVKFENYTTMLIPRSNLETGINYSLTETWYGNTGSCRIRFVDADNILVQDYISTVAALNVTAIEIYGVN